MAQLKIIRGREVGRAVAVEGEVYLGRDEENGLRLQDERSSRRHARVQKMEDRCILYDLGSNNGTFVNGERVREHLLRDGDRILIGKTTLVFEEEDGRRKPTVTVTEIDQAGRVEGSLSADVPPAITPDVERLRRLYEIAALLNGSLEPAPMAQKLASVLRGALDADVVAIVDGAGDVLACAQEGGLKEVALSGGLIERARRERQALLVASAAEDQSLKQRKSVVRGQIQSIVCAPLLRGVRWLGALYADLRQPGRRFSREDLAFVAAAAHQSALAFEAAARFRTAQARVTELSEQVGKRSELVGRDPALLEVVRLAERVAMTDSTVLILGESGTGKELFARLIHDRSARAGGPFVAINCAAITESLLESELFGHEKGAFTGAVRERPGKFETAEEGTLFLDEIGEISPGMQVKLLRFLQERTYFRVGGTKPRSVNVRIVAATNRDLAAAVREKQFREDLFFRLSVVTLTIPPLRERRDDIPLLAGHFIARMRERMRRPAVAIAPEAVKALEKHAWPGNVRELENVIERAMIMTDGETIERSVLPIELGASASAGGEFPVNLAEMEPWCIRRALERTGGKKGEAAKLLGISWPTLNKKLRDYGIE